MSPHNNLNLFVKLSALLGFTKSIVLADDTTKNWGTFSDVNQVFEGGLQENDYKCGVAVDGYGYIGSDTETPIVRKIDLSTMAAIGAVPNTEYKFYKHATVDPTGTNGIFCTLDPGKKSKKSAVVVIELETLLTKAVVEHADSNGFTTSVTAGNHVLYGTAGTPAKVFSFDMVAQAFETEYFEASTNEDNFQLSITDGTHAYFVPEGTTTLIKINVTDLTRDSSFTMGDAGESLVSAVYQESGNFGYFGTSTGRVIKVHLPGMAVNKNVTATAGDGTFGSTAVIYGDHAYFTTATRIVQYDVSGDTPERVASVANPATNVEAVMLQVVDNETVYPYAYYIGKNSPGTAHRVSLTKATLAPTPVPPTPAPTAEPTAVPPTADPTAVPATNVPTAPVTSGSRGISSGCDDAARLSFFNSLDTDNNNELSAEEVEEQFEKLNVPDRNASKLAEVLVREEDTDDTNSLNCAEFTHDISSMLKEPTAAQGAACADTNGDGLVSQEEYTEYMGGQATGLNSTANAVEFSRLAVSDEAEQFDRYDTNNDGLLNEDEFQEYLTNYTYLEGVSTDEASQKQVDTIMGAAPTDKGFISSLVSKGSTIVGRTDGKLVPFCPFYQLRPGSWQRDFIHSDVNNNGRVSVPEHRATLGSNGTDPQIIAIVDGGELDDDNALEFPEYRRLRQLAPTSVQREFIEADTDRNGRVENDELRAMWAADGGMTEQDASDLMVDSGDLEADGLNYPQYVKARGALDAADSDNDRSITSDEFGRYRETNQGMGSGSTSSSGRGVLDKKPCYVGKLRCWLFGVILAGLILFCCALFLCLVCCRQCFWDKKRERETHTTKQETKQEHNPLAAKKVLATEERWEEGSSKKVPTETVVQQQRDLTVSETRGRVNIMSEEMKDGNDMQTDFQRGCVEMQGHSAQRAALIDDEERRRNGTEIEERKCRSALLHDSETERRNLAEADADEEARRRLAEYEEEEHRRREAEADEERRRREAEYEEEERRRREAEAEDEERRRREAEAEEEERQRREAEEAAAKKPKKKRKAKTLRGKKKEDDDDEDQSVSRIEPGDF